MLHNTLEGFHHRMERVKVRLEQKQRALSTSSVASDSVHTPTTPQSVSEATPTTKTVSLPVTTSTGCPGSSCPRPRRPAPIAPCRAQEPPRETDQTGFPYQYSQEGPFFGSTSLIATAPFHTTMESGQVFDLDITQTEEPLREEPEAVVEGEREGEGEGEGEGEETVGQLGYFQDAQIRYHQQSSNARPVPIHQRSVSDTSVLLCRTNSSSLPELDDHNSSASPDPVADTVEGARQQISQESPTKFRTKHTRHLSLLNRRQAKRKKRRSQYRCRSPPNYPPPPPPMNGDSDNEEDMIEEGQGLDFSKVMQTISSIDQELQEMGGVSGNDVTPNISPPMRFRAVDSQVSPSQDPAVREGRHNSTARPTEEQQDRLETATRYHL